MSVPRYIGFLTQRLKHEVNRFNHATAENPIDCYECPGPFKQSDQTSRGMVMSKQIYSTGGSKNRSLALTHSYYTCHSHLSAMK
eukprot:COSAG02_NODE_916_length_15971_cov_12.781061_17_plen_84_part_00